MKDILGNVDFANLGLGGFIQLIIDVLKYIVDGFIKIFCPPVSE